MGEDGRTIYCSNLSEKVTERLLYELFLQAGPILEVRIPMSNGRPRSFGFVTFKHECSVIYASKLMQNTVLFGRTLQVRPSVRGNQPPQNSHQQQPQRREIIQERLGMNDHNSLRGLTCGKRYLEDDMRPDDLRKRLKQKATQQPLNTIVAIPPIDPSLAYLIGLPMMPEPLHFFPGQYQSQVSDFNGWNYNKEYDKRMGRGHSRYDGRRHGDRFENRSGHHSGRHTEHRRSRY